MVSDITILGDSVLRGVTLSNEDRYYVNSTPEKSFASFTGIAINNLSHMGYTTTKSIKTVLSKATSFLTSQITTSVQEPVKKTDDSHLVLIEYGGNDCDYKWSEVSSAPHASHECNVIPEVFEKNYKYIINKIKETGAKPVAVTLVPLNAERYFNWFSRKDVVSENVLQWLNEVNFIYRWQEMYSSMVRSISEAENIELFDLRSIFLEKHNLSDYICGDGIHPSVLGQELIWSSFCERFCGKSLTFAT